MKNDTNTLLYTSEAKEWNEALPIGNGKLGAMVFGGTKKERLALNHDELWSGFPRQCDDKCIKEQIKQASKLCLDGKPYEANELIRTSLSGPSVQGYMPLGSLYIESNITNIDNYERNLSLENAVSTVSYTADGDNKVVVKSFASFPKNVIVWHLESTNNIDFKIYLESELHHTVNVNNDTITLDGECPNQSPKNLREPWDLSMVYSDDPKLRGILFRASAKIISNGIMFKDGNSIRTTSRAITIVITAESSFNGSSKHPFIEGKEYKSKVDDVLSTVASCSFDDILSEHIADYSALYNRNSLEISHNQVGDLNTANRVKNSASANDIGLVILLYNYAKYLLISASREGSQAMNLQGIWNQDLAPAWNSNYTTNINTQMNYWTALTMDLPELNMPLIQKIKGLSELGKRTAKIVYGSDGFVAHYNSDLWDKTYAGGGNPRYAYWPMGSGWLCRHLYDHYLYTNDEHFLMETAFPIMLEAAKFYLCNMEKDPNGYYVMTPAVSPENEYYDGENKCGISYTTTMTISIIRDLFNNCLSSAKVLNITCEEIDKIKEYLPNLLPTRIGKDGDILEWYSEQVSTEPHHRHTSHLYGLYPAHEITIEKTPELIKAARKTLELRGDLSTGWSMAWKICFYARLRDGNHAESLIKNLMSPVEPTRYWGGSGGMYPNLFDAHPPFQIDGNFGLAAGISEMLVQTDGENTYILPALPDAWNSGSFVGVRVPGGAKIDFSWENNTLCNIIIHGTPKGSIVYNGKRIN